jgi:hypothetical protein
MKLYMEKEGDLKPPQPLPVVSPIGKAVMLLFELMATGLVLAVIAFVVWFIYINWGRFPCMDEIMCG